MGHSRESCCGEKEKYFMLGNAKLGSPPVLSFGKICLEKSDSKTLFDSFTVKMSKCQNVKHYKEKESILGFPAGSSVEGCRTFPPFNLLTVFEISVSSHLSLGLALFWYIVTNLRDHLEPKALVFRPQLYILSPWHWMWLVSWETSNVKPWTIPHGKKGVKHQGGIVCVRRCKISMWNLPLQCVPNLTCTSHLPLAIIRIVSTCKNNKESTASIRSGIVNTWDKH